MPKKQISSEKISKPNGHFSQATVIEARGRIVFISGMTARRPDGKRQHRAGASISRTNPDLPLIICGRRCGRQTGLAGDSRRQT